MNRRALLAATGGGFATAVAGCLGVTPPADDSHPLAGMEPTVRIDAESASPYDLDRNAREALAFWEGNSEQYAGFSISFEVVDHDDPDMLIAYTDSSQGCENVENYSELVMGCAPLLGPGRRVDRPITARVVAARRPIGQIRTTTKHEIGHVLGLDHDAEPREIMSNRPEDRIPEYATRIEIWERVQAVNERSVAATGLLNHGIELFGGGEFDATAAAFEAANSDFVELRESIDLAIDRTVVFEDIERVETVALETLRDHLGQIRRRMVIAEELTAALGRAAEAATAGDDAEREDAISTANERITAFNEIGPVQLREIAVALGLVRGFENEAPVIDLGEDDLDEQTID
ncbi:matrixin family metalloprotease [Halobacteriaceae archaeon SHR40]|uniref:matrixin family metalloprotease n=1 Tax=Halovenus amylolytica TaxID=2500550 RepID=UPI000FE303FE